MILGMFLCSAYFHAFSVPTSIPELASTTKTALLATLRAPYTSPTKSKYPGVSRKLILVLSYSIGMIEVPIETCLSFSSLSKSETVLPSSTLPMRFVTLVKYKSDSVSVVLPQLLWPIKATFLILSVLYVFIYFIPPNRFCLFIIFYINLHDKSI
ncbi:hypothetical protein SDC9_51830 [bioreactor metagenome]|uniref:Uncharacterized protein n=1 Tax=bioreactor metagenome TaxID=1076179 RepID=A0A644WP13_9ZZZZ